MVEVNLVLVYSRKTNCFRIIHSSCKGKENWWFLHKKVPHQCNKSGIYKNHRKVKGKSHLKWHEWLPNENSQSLKHFLFPLSSLHKSVFLCFPQMNSHTHSNTYYNSEAPQGRYLPCGVFFAELCKELFLWTIALYCSVEI